VMVRRHRFWESSFCRLSTPEDLLVALLKFPHFFSQPFSASRNNWSVRQSSSAYLFLFFCRYDYIPGAEKYIIPL
jgi:hypothetical protein